MSLIHKSVYTCQEASELIVKRHEQKLTRTQRFKLWLHLIICKACKQFEIQNSWIDKQLHKLAHAEHVSEMPSETRQKIKTTLDQEIKD